MKKILVFAVVLALLAPAAAFAATEFTLGGFIKLDTYWDSTQNGKNINNIVLRGNDSSFHHGNFRGTAQGSRFNLTIKGPKVFGAVVTGYLEMDFDSDTNQNASASNSYIPRLRHAMFRFNWPTTELLLGQYFSFFSEWYIESAEDGPFQVTGTPTARLAQVRLTQKFAGAWTVAALVGNPNSDFITTQGTNNFNNPYNASTNSGNSAETPQIQAKVQFAQDLWGKAAYYGRPIPFTAQLAAGWQRNVYRTTTNLNLSNFFDSTTAMANQQLGNTYVSPWLVMGSLFIPVIPTHTANLAGTAHLLTQWWIGQGVTAFGFTGDATTVFQNVRNNRWNMSLLPRFGGMIEGQYYFTNQWFLNAAYGISKTYGIGQSNSWAYLSNPAGAANTNNLSTASGINGQMSTMQQVDLTLWYRPVQAIKFGMQYAWARTTFWQTITNPAAGNSSTNFGNEHRVEFVGFFYF